jgi:hypothetical protein
MLVEKCKRVMMEERSGRRHAHRMAREMADAIHNPVASLSSTIGAAEDASAGVKVLLLLAGVGAVGGGIYYLATRPKTAAAAATTTANTSTTAPGSLVIPAFPTFPAGSGPTPGMTVAAMVVKAVTLAALGHGPDAGVDWVAAARAAGTLTTAQLSQLRTAGYAV